VYADGYGHHCIRLLELSSKTDPFAAENSPKRKKKKKKIKNPRFFCGG
jgi:hypothetical protein